MNSCKHCMEIKKNEIGETIAFCEFSGLWENVTLGSCFGNCGGQEYTADYIARRLQELSFRAYNWNINNKVVGVDVCEFEQLMTVAAEMILGRYKE